MNGCELIEQDGEPIRRRFPVLNRRLCDIDIRYPGKTEREGMPAF